MTESGCVFASQSEGDLRETRAGDARFKRHKGNVDADKFLERMHKSDA